MTARSEKYGLLGSLEVEIGDELELVKQSEIRIEEAESGGLALSPSDIVREEVGLRSLLGAAEALDVDTTRADRL